MPICISNRKQKDCIDNCMDNNLKINLKLGVSYSISGLDRGEGKASLNAGFLSQVMSQF